MNSISRGISETYDQKYENGKDKNIVFGILLDATSDHILADS